MATTWIEGDLRITHRYGSIVSRIYHDGDPEHLKLKAKVLIKRYQHRINKKDIQSITFYPVPIPVEI